MNRMRMVLTGLLAFGFLLLANAQEPVDSAKQETIVNDTLTADSAMALTDADLNGTEDVDEQGGGLHKQLKRNFIEGSAGFMSHVALA